MSVCPSAAFSLNLNYVMDQLLVNFRLCPIYALLCFTSPELIAWKQMLLYFTTWCMYALDV
jgi:hypothetical protein